MIAFPLLSILGALAAARTVESPALADARISQGWSRALAAAPVKGWAPLIGLDLENASVRDRFIATMAHTQARPNDLVKARTYDDKAFLIEEALGRELQPLIGQSGLRYPNQRARQIIQRLRVAAPPQTLAELFDGLKIKSVFDGDAGSGQWQRDIRRQAWLDGRALIVGYDLKAPKYYGGLPINPKTHWRGLTVLNTPSHPLYPREGTVDLAHIGFMDMWENSWAKRLRRYLALVRDGGWAIMAHSHAYDNVFWKAPIIRPRQKVRDRLVEETMNAGPWRLKALYERNSAPSDYPVTDWWREFIRAHQPDGLKLQNLDARGFDTSNFVLVFRKGS